MKSARVIVFSALAAALMVACGPRRIAGPSPPAQDLIVLLPDSETGLTGRALVSSEGGTASLEVERDSIHVSAHQPPGAVSTLSNADVKGIFGDALSALPPAPRHFTLYFRFESDELTDDSRALVPEILKTVKATSVPEVAVVGHTDTTGAPDANFKLGLKRATTVRDLLVKAGLDPSFIEVTSHGKADLLIQTADQTLEPRNRRVDIAVR
jgi:outer membrane protein OmpA-like peptidoglycan-associated protein